MVAAGLSVEIKRNTGRAPDPRQLPVCPLGSEGCVQAPWTVCCGSGRRWGLGGAGGFLWLAHLLAVWVTRQCARVQFCLLFVEAEFIYSAVSFKCTYIYIYFFQIVFPYRFLKN